MVALQNTCFISVNLCLETGEHKVPFLVLKKKTFPQVCARGGLEGNPFPAGI